jgi:hypothetical protein
MDELYAMIHLLHVQHHKVGAHTAQEYASRGIDVAKQIEDYVNRFGETDPNQEIWMRLYIQVEPRFFNERGGEIPRVGFGGSRRYKKYTYWHWIYGDELTRGGIHHWNIFLMSTYRAFAAHCRFPLFGRQKEAFLEAVSMIGPAQSS